MSCSCDSRLDSIMKLLEEMRAEIRVVKTEIRAVKEEIGAAKVEVGAVKTKCIRIEKEILGITAESEVNADALMETTTVRHLVEKLAFDVSVLTVESNDRASAEAKQQEKIAAATMELHSKFSEATHEEIKHLRATYDIMAPETLDAEFAGLTEGFRSQTEKALSKRGFTSPVIYEMVEEVTRTRDSFQLLYDRYFSDTNKEMESLIREKYPSVVQIYANKAIEGMDNLPGIGLRVVLEFLREFKLCEKSFATFQRELLGEFGTIDEQIEANRGLLERLTGDYRPISLPGSISCKYNTMRRQELEMRLQSEIIVSDPKLVPIFMKKLRQNMRDLSNTWSRT